MTVDPRERKLLAQFLGVAVVRFDVDRPFEEERLVQAVELFLNRLRGALRSIELFADRAFRAFQICSTDSLSSRM